MESLQNNRDDEKETHARRSARIEQMKREKELQEQRRRLIKRYFPYAIGGLSVVVFVLIVITLLSGNRSTDNKSQVKEETGIGVVSVEEDFLNGSPTEHADGQLNSNENAVRPESAATVLSDTAETAAVTPKYTFDTTDDTLTIFSDNVISTNAILINESTNTIVAQKNASQRINPASMTKVLTVLVAAENISADELDNTLTMTTDITDYAYVNGCSSVGFLADEVVTVRDLFYGTTLHSGGDAAVGLAVYVAGSHEAFVDKMNAKLEELGIAKTTHYTNCVGLYDENHYSTVYDMAVIMKAAMQNELCREFLSLHTYTTSGTQQHPEGITISNWFLRKIEDKDTGGLVLCAKTGYVAESKNCAVSYEIYGDGTPYICVTTGSTSSWRCIYDHVEIYNQYIG